MCCTIRAAATAAQGDGGLQSVRLVRALADGEFAQDFAVALTHTG
jgi:hypothetical protein